MNFLSFFDFFKFFDDTIGDLLEQMLPSDSRFLGSSYVIESHALERPKFAYKYYDMARTTIMCFPEGMNHKVPTSWKNLLSAARTFLKLCINVSSKGNVEYEKWNCNVCNVSVQPQKKKHMVIWECPCCLGRPSLMHHMFIYTRGNSDMNKFYNYLLNTRLLEES